MAKCIKKQNDRKRVSNTEAKNLVEKEGWKYCTKTEWQRVTDAQSRGTPK